jgi:hypothetical protein
MAGALGVSLGKALRLGNLPSFWDGFGRPAAGTPDDGETISGNGVEHPAAEAPPAHPAPLLKIYIYAPASSASSANASKAVALATQFREYRSQPRDGGAKVGVRVTSRLVSSAESGVGHSVRFREVRCHVSFLQHRKCAEGRIRRDGPKH